MSVVTKMLDAAALATLARRLRKLVIETVHTAGAGHTGGSLSEIDILAALYFSFLEVDPSRPGSEDRDRFILSKGHASVGYYATLAARGYFPEEELRSFDRVDSRLQAHPDMHKCPGVDYSTGSLGQGLSVGVGMALGAVKLGKRFRTVVLLGDGECQEGQVWEAAMFAGSNRLPRLFAIVDYNNVQLSSKVEDSTSLEPFADKWKAFGWHVLSADGHDSADLLRTLAEADGEAAKGPVAIIAKTIKGKGVSFMEGKFEWHGKAPTDAEYAAAMQELAGEEAAHANR
ncbi:MAG: transketolase [Rectinemataceae bacterium]